MARRAALARAIALDPDLIMYDEPFVGQDPITMGVLCFAYLVFTRHWIISMAGFDIENSSVSQ